MRNFRNNRRRFRSNSFDRNTKINSNDQNINVSLGNISDIIPQINSIYDKLIKADVHNRW